MLSSEAITKIQSIVLVAVIVVASVGGSVAYILLSGEEPSAETIKIGVLANLDVGGGQETWEGVNLAAEQINAEGGLLGRQIEVFGEDQDGGRDPVMVSTALNRLISHRKVDFIIGQPDSTVQEIISEHNKIFIGTSGPEILEQRVLDDYEKYKYYFTCSWNSTSVLQGMTSSLESLRQNTGFNKIGIIGIDIGFVHTVIEGLDSFLPQNGFEVVYKRLFPLGTLDFSSYFAAAEAAGVENMLTLISTEDAIPFVKEWYDRQSPMFIFGGLLADIPTPEAWDYTDGKCEDVCAGGLPIAAAYPYTSKTLVTRQAFIDKGFETPMNAIGYDIVRFILADAIERAGTIETDAVIKALEETSIETSNARDFVFTSSHGVMMGVNPNDPNADYPIVMGFQWQNGQLVPVDPTKIMEEAGTSYTYPPWPGPWN